MMLPHDNVSKLEKDTDVEMNAIVDLLLKVLQQTEKNENLKRAVSFSPALRPTNNMKLSTERPVEDAVGLFVTATWIN